MSALPKVSLRRTLLIARRDYIGYVKTWGFWISFLMPFIFGALGFMFSQSDFEFSETQTIAVLDETGVHRDGLQALYDEVTEENARDAMRPKALFIQEPDKRKAFQRILRVEGSEAAQAYLEAEVPGVPTDYKAEERTYVLVDPPATTLDAILPYLRGEKMMEVDGEPTALGGLIVFKPGESADRPQAEYWSTNISRRNAPNLVDRYLRRVAEVDYLGSKGLSVAELDRRVADAPEASLFNPNKTETEDQDVTSSDTIPFLAAAAASALLWLTVFSGAYMLLTSMLEEKLNKLLEMMLATTRFSEILLGKLLGVAALTLSMMAPYLIVAIGGVIGYVFFGPDQDIAKGLASAFDAKMVIFLIIYFILGYILYGALFITMGALSASMQDAQTLTTPILLILMACIAVVPIGLNDPNSPILQIATFIPFSAPFAAIVRIPADPPLWELLLSAGFLLLLCIGTVALANRIFRYGVLSGAGADVVIGWFKRVVLRRSA